MLPGTAQRLCRQRDAGGIAVARARAGHLELVQAWAGAAGDQRSGPRGGSDPQHKPPLGGHAGSPLLSTPRSRDAEVLVRPARTRTRLSGHRLDGSAGASPTLPPRVGRGDGAGGHRVEPSTSTLRRKRTQNPIARAAASCNEYAGSCSDLKSSPATSRLRVQTHVRAGRPAMVKIPANRMGRAGIEPATLGLKVQPDEAQRAAAD